MTIDHDTDDLQRSHWLASAGPFKCAFVGAAYSVLGAFPAAAIVALVFRFPFPFGAYEGGLRAMLGSPIAVVFYGLVGGFHLLAVLGALAGWIAYARGQRRSYRNKHREIVLFALAIDFAVVLLLSVWDKIYGPW